MDYSEAKEYIHNTGAYGCCYGLDSIIELLHRLSNPQNDLKFIHIAGTNGKGSVLAYLASILKTAGYTAGRYTSPALNSYREIIQVNDSYIEKQGITKYISKIKSVVNEMLEEGFGHPTRFEIETALAFLYFKDKKCDIVLLETGLGGLEDATNIVETSIIEIITSVSMDHKDVLGGTIQEITRHKAGIIKESTYVVSINQKPEVIEILKDTCKKKNCPLILAEPHKLSSIEYGIEKQIFSYQSEAGTFYRDIMIHMAGIHQLENAIISIEAALALNKFGFPVTENQIRKGLSDTSWTGRFTLLRRSPVFIIDGAHNEDAAVYMKKNIELYFKGKRLIFIMGIFKDKDYEKIAGITAALADDIITINMPENGRLLTSSRLKEVIGKYNNNVQESVSVKDAVEKSFKLAGPLDVIIAFGSLSFLNEIERSVNAVN